MNYGAYFYGYYSSNYGIAVQYWFAMFWVAVRNSFSTIQPIYCTTKDSIHKSYVPLYVINSLIESKQSDDVS